MKYLWHVMLLFKKRWAALALLLMLIVFFVLPPRDIFSQRSSCTLISHEGIVLHVFRDRESGTFHEWIPISEIPAHLAEIIIFTEDRWFFWHPGINPFAMVRALWQNISSRRIVSGASTITQQIVRIVYGDQMPKLRLLRKLVEIFLALKLELHYSKKEILEAYLNLVGFPLNCSGIAMASRMMFDHDVQQLTFEESCALAVFIRRSAMSQDAFQRRYAVLIDKFVHRGMLNTPICIDRVKEFTHSIFTNTNRTISTKQRMIFENQFNPGSVAPHFVAYFRQHFPLVKGIVRTTLSANLNKAVHEILRHELVSVKKYGGTNGAVIVLEITPNESYLLLRAMVGSIDYFDDDGGQVNGTLTIRSAGSTLKPFVYALAFDLLHYRPWTVVYDMPFAFETAVEGEVFQPQNFDLRFWGALTMRDALATSRNVPAVWLVKKIGEEKFYDFLKNAGFDHLCEEPQHHGLGMALGSAGASLLQLAHAYAAFPLKGEMHPICIGMIDDGTKLVRGHKKTLFSRTAAYYITHILADREARRRAFGKRNFQDFPFEVASKTGTSSDYRDAWIVGYTEKYVVGVWVGNFSGKKMHGVSGGWGAGRVFHQVMRVLENSRMPRFEYPADWKFEAVCRITGKRAGKLCPQSIELVSSTDKIEDVCALCGSALARNHHIKHYAFPHIVSPVHGQVFMIDPHMDRRIQRIPLIIECSQNISSQWAFQINDGVKEPLVDSIKRPLDLKEGSHQIQLYENGILKQKVCFKIVK